MKANWVIHKFGGTSVANAERIKAVAKILEAPGAGPQAVVVSAMSKVTDALIELTELALKQDSAYLDRLGALEQKHLEAIRGLLPASGQAAMATTLAADFQDIREILRGVWLVRTCSERIRELISGFGELWSAQFLCAYLRSQGAEAVWLDARKVLFVEPGENSVTIDWKVSQAKLDAWVAAEVKPATRFLVITGFIASTPEGVATTLKRNGSDFSGSIFGALLKVSSITIWTDVDGVLSADPRLVPDAVLVDELSYDEATELAYFGAKVVHPSTMAPAIRDGIPIWIKNTFRPEVRGTKISAKPAPGVAVKGFATIDGVSLVNLEGTGMIGVPGIAQRLFGSLKEVGVSVIMISQASSEHSICFAVPGAQGTLAKSTVERAFFAEIHQGQIQTVDVTEDCSVLAMVGDGMVDRPGVAGAFFTALGNAGVNIRAIAQGSSERNISAVIAGNHARRALRAIHSAFYLSNQTISVGLIGPGLIGAAFLRQLRGELKKLRDERKIDIRVRGILNSKMMLLDEQSIELDGWENSLRERGEKMDLAKFVEHVHAAHLPHAVIIDATASAEVPRHYPAWLESGIHVITPNKKANTAELAFYQKLRELTRTHQRHYLYRTTVGAGLPILLTLRDLVQTGDRIIQIEGVVSGTLSYLFNSFNGRDGKSFSEIVKEAKHKGYTEPDPRDDLSGMDVARKLVIMAREVGYGLELADIPVQSLVPESLRGVSTADYLARLPEQDAEMAKLLASAQAQGGVLRYVGTIDHAGRAKVELKTFGADHPFAKIRGSDNIVAFRTARYDAQPLVIQGPGAGPEVTAGGVFADLLRLAAYVGAPL